MPMEMKTNHETPVRIQGTLGLVAGGGQFPLMCAREALSQGIKVVAVAHRGETAPELDTLVHEVEWIHLGQLGRLIKTFRKAGVRQVLFAGTITKARIFKDVRPDLRALNLWRKIDRRLDDQILRAVASELEDEGLEVIPSTVLLPHLFAPSGPVTRNRPSRAQWKDIRFGWDLAKEIGRLDIGQCIVVKDRAVLAVEAIEGTDQTILRGGKLGGPGAVVVKICKPNQDIRFDLPSVGLRTIENMKEVGASVLAVQAGKTLIFDMKDVIESASRSGIAIVGVDGED